MDSQDLRNLYEAYSSVYEATGREEMIAANRARAKATTSSTAPKPTTTAPKPTGPVAQAPKPVSDTISSLDKAARDTAGKVGEVIGRNRGRQTGIPGGGFVGGLVGRNRAQGMYDKAKETVSGLLKQDYEPDAFDVILEYLVAEGYAETNENALVIMANMSAEWRQTILEYGGGGGAAPNAPNVLVKAVDKLGGMFGKVAPKKPVKKQTPDGFNPHQKFN